MALRPHTLAFKYCVGRGAELGAAAHNSFQLPDCPNIAPSDGTKFLFPRDLEDYANYVAEQQRCLGVTAPVDLIGDFQNIPFGSNELDYIISSHVIEHEPNPIAGLLEAHRVLKEGGVFFCIFPKRNAEKNYDAFRALTTQDQFIESFREKVTVTTSPMPWRCHYHVYSLQSMLSLVNWINRTKLAAFLIEAIEETDSKVGNGHTVILRKVSPEMLAGDGQLPSFATIEAAIQEQNYEAALLAAKIRLSIDFFEHQVLYAAAVLYVALDARLEGQEFLRQALILNPESELYRKEYFSMFNQIYENPLV